MKTNLAEGKRPALLKNIAPGATIDMSGKQNSNGRPRAFKTAWFAKAAQKADISDKVLCKAIQQVLLGQADDLGGGVFKKRLNDNMHRSIILARGGKLWVYEFLFAKKDFDNINEDQLTKFRKLAKGYEVLTEHQLNHLLDRQIFTEICHADKTDVSK